MTPKIGTTEYMAPENYAGMTRAKLADRADVWSVGVVLHVIFLGHFPSTKLVDDSAAYFAAPCWSNVSKRGLDLLAQLLRVQPARRPRVATALRHPWLAVATTSPPSLAEMHLASRAFASNSELRKLALLAAAREVSDLDATALRSLWRSLELHCAGNLTRESLQRTSKSVEQLAALTEEFAQSFDDLDLDGSGSLDWTELLAVALGVASCQPVVPLRDEACFRAFGLLGQGGDVTSESLRALLGDDRVANGPAWLEGHSVGSTGGSGSGPPHRASRFDAWVREVEPSGSIDFKQFVALLSDRST